VVIDRHDRDAASSALEVDTDMEDNASPVVGCSANTVCVAQHCDNSGWKKGFVPREGMVLRAPRAGGSDFANDASYLTMPAGWQATVIVNSKFKQTVGQNRGWSFCHRGGFNDQVGQIVISRDGPAPTAAPTRKPKAPAKAPQPTKPSQVDGDQNDDLHGLNRHQRHLRV
jgi:hypothetical protein